MIGQRLYVALVELWWMPMLGALLAGGIGLAIGLQSTAQYEATGAYVLSPRAAPDTAEGVDLVAEGLGALSSNGGTLVNTYADMVASPRVVSEAALQIGMDPDERAEYAASGVRTPDSNVVLLSITGPDPQRAAEFGEAIAENGADLFADLFGVVEVAPIRPPQSLGGPVNTSPEQLATIAAVLGMVAGALFAFVRDAVRAAAEPTPPVTGTPRTDPPPAADGADVDDRDRSAVST